MMNGWRRIIKGLNRPRSSRVHNPPASMGTAVIAAVILAGTLLAGCGPQPADEDFTVLLGNIAIEENTLFLYEKEWVTPDQTDRVGELGLDPQTDFPNGYYVHDPGTEAISFQLTDETIYTFVAFEDLPFMEEGQDRNYTTEKIEEFLLYLAVYPDDPWPPTVLFFVEADGRGRVVSVTERFTP